MPGWSQRVLRVAPQWLGALWLMSLTTLGFFVVPMLFANLPSPAIAGAMAGKLFSGQTGISVLCCLSLLLLSRTQQVPSSGTDRLMEGSALLGGALALAVELVIAPHILAHDNLRLWHSLGSGLYLLQWCCALVAFGRLSGARGAP